MKKEKGAFLCRVFSKFTTHLVEPRILKLVNVRRSYESMKVMS